MSKLLHIAKPALLGVILAAGSLTAAVSGLSSTTPTFASQPPQISALGQGGSARVWGFNFAPNAIERIQLVDASSHVQATAYIRALSNGQLGWTQIRTSYVGPVSVVASKFFCLRIGIGTFCRYWTQSTTKVTVYAAPHLDEVYGESHAVNLWGSGFTPGSLVTIELFDGNLHLLDKVYDTADNSNTYLRGTISGDWLHTGSYTGHVYVVAFGSPHQSNWVSLNVGA